MTDSKKGNIMAIKPIRVLGDPILRGAAIEVDQSKHHEELGGIIADMVDTMRTLSGVGIAAPQIGVPLQVLAIEVRDIDRYRHAQLHPLTVCINPKLTILANTQRVSSWEGCLSVPGLRGRLDRYSSVRITGLNEELSPVNLILNGFPAIVAQREVDHLEGRVYLDRMASLETLCFETHYKAMTAIQDNSVDGRGAAELSSKVP